MNDNTHYLTPEGKAKLEAELKHLKEDERKKISERLKQAISMGDLSENADYQKAKEDQGFLEGRIQEIEAILLHAEVIEAQVNYDEVAIGAKVTFKVADDPPQSYTLVDSNEANPSEGKISYRSPVGSALVGHQVGDRVKVVLPNQEIIELEILNIE
ncbi:MAG TPA: transcription elongation factor GreA [Brevefilum fermentans]|jgi:transcription elongation factor GreA|uniref:Transcription elongation factor GreA n=1 Tax=Candidatus Brevifilum fermentans TaxID=1986204 RepID=A0A1Y6K9P7_9CHLR|nr:transcription elongation factor GreA [Brevefilum fermentans]MDI9566642.1 transcription elongation factor GreA [Chloroflexota bacterium]OQB83396.1 MAG: Transcription elongation factor GreA [Chloroflexi bacterium ADurb.Bin120]SMX54760.1 Transcription elongation factor GreA [Brevefilum fermentans]HOM66441.1 transcription elongation factor GreA [Brevefilum fermentans]HPX95068.1 transcription elongation factor GreA [Brevefilum fermentans]